MVIGSWSAFILFLIEVKDRRCCGLVRPCVLALCINITWDSATEDAICIFLARMSQQALMPLFPYVKQYVLSVIRLSQLYSIHRVKAFNSACIFILKPKDSVKLYPNELARLNRQSLKSAAVAAVFPVSVYFHYRLEPF